MAHVGSIEQLEEFDSRAVHSAFLAHLDVMLQMRPECGCSPQDLPKVRDRARAALRDDGPVMDLVRGFEAVDAEAAVIRWSLLFVLMEYVGHVTKHDGHLPPANYDGTPASTLNAHAKQTEALVATLEQDGAKGLNLASLNALAEDLHELLDVARTVEHNREEGRRWSTSGRPPLFSTLLASRLDGWLEKAGVPKRRSLLVGILAELFDEYVSEETLRSRLIQFRRRRAKPLPDRV